MNSKMKARSFAGTGTNMVNALGWLVLAFLGALVLGVSSGCSKNPAELQKEFQAKGLHYLQEGKSSEAIIEFQNLVKVNPKFANGHYWLGEAYRQNGWILDAVLQFRQAEELDPLLLAPYIGLARYGVDTGQWVAASKQIETALKLDPNNPEAWIMKAQVATSKNDLSEALADVRKVLSQKPEYVPAWVEMGDIRQSQNRIAESKEYYKKALAQDAQNSHAWIGLGIVASKEKNPQEALEDFRKAVSSRPQSIRANIVLANALANQRHIHQAIAQLKTLSGKHVDIRVPVKIAEYETLLGENQKAISILQPIADQKTQIADVYYVLALAYQQSGHARRSLDALNHLSEVSFTTPLYSIGAGRIALSVGQPQEALAFLKPVRKPEDRSPAYWDIRARANLALGHPDVAIREIRKALAASPGIAGLEILEADALVASKRPKDALSVLERVLEKEPGNIPAIVRKAKLLAALRGHSAGVAFLREEVGTYPGNDVLESAYLIALSGNRSASQVAALAQNYLTNHPQAAGVRRILASLEVSTNKEGEAMDQLKAILAQNPNDMGALSAMALLDLHIHNFKEAESIFRKALAISPENAGFYAGLGDALTGEDRVAEARKAFESSLKRDPEQKGALLGIARIEVFSGESARAMGHLEPLMKGEMPTENRSEILWLWGLANMNVGKFSEAGRALKASVALAPENPLNHASLGDYWESQSQWKNASSEYAKSLALDPKNRIISLKKDWVAIRADTSPPSKEELVRIRDRAMDFLKDHPGNDIAALIAAQSDIFMKKPDDAIKAFDLILSHNPDSSLALIGKSQILSEQGHFKQARDILNRLIANHPNDARVNLLMAQIDQKLGDTGDEAARLEVFNHAHPEQVDAALSLVAADLALHKYSEAQSLAQTIAQKHPGNSLAVYYQAQAKMGLSDYRGALRTLARTVAAEKNQAPFYALMGEAELHLGENDAAIRDMKKAIRLAPRDPMTLNNLAYLLSGNPVDLPEALTYSKKALSLSKEPSIQDTVGYILFRMGNYKEADAYFQSAFDAHFRDPEFLYHMGMNEWRLGRNAMAQERLKKAMLSGNLSPEEVKNSKKILKAIQSQRM